MSHDSGSVAAGSDRGAEPGESSDVRDTVRLRASEAAAVLSLQMHLRYMRASGQEQEAAKMSFITRRSVYHLFTAATCIVFPDGRRAAPAGAGAGAAALV